MFNRELGTLKMVRNTKLLHSLLEEICLIREFLYLNEVRSGNVKTLSFKFEKEDESFLEKSQRCQWISDPIFYKEEHEGCQKEECQ